MSILFWIESRVYRRAILACAKHAPTMAKHIKPPPDGVIGRLRWCWYMTIATRWCFSGKHKFTAARFDEKTHQMHGVVLDGKACRYCGHAVIDAERMREEMERDREAKELAMRHMTIAENRRRAIRLVGDDLSKSAW